MTLIKPSEESDYVQTIISDGGMYMKNINEQISQAKRILFEEPMNRLVLRKECKQEMIKLYFDYRPITRTIYHKTKEHYKINEGHYLHSPSKCKKTEMNVPVCKFIDNELYELLNKGYQIVE